MTVKEVAKYLKLSEMMIYKLAQNGEIPASKIGSAWRFSQDEIDGWLLRKKRFKEVWLPEPAASALRDIIRDLKGEFRDNLSDVVIYGSYARGNATKDSDLDLLVVLKSIKDHWQTDRIITEIAYNDTFGKNRSIVIAPVLMDEEEYLTRNTPLLLNIREEGKKAA